MEDNNSNNNGTLNLDEALGQKILKVRYQGKEYPIRAVKSLSPAEYGHIMAYGEKFSNITQDDMNLNGGITIMKAIDDVLSIIGPELPKYKPTLKEYFSRGYKRKFALSLHECIAVMQFWNENNHTKNSLRAVMPPKKRQRR